MLVCALESLKSYTCAFCCLLYAGETGREEELDSVLTVQGREYEYLPPSSFPVSNNDSFHHHLALTPFCSNYC